MAARRIVLLTGATRGIGRAMAEEFARLGHVVIGCGRSHADVASLRQKLGKPNDVYEVDVASDEEVKSWASLVLASHGTPDLLLNNAGVIHPNARVWEVSARDFEKVVAVNLIGTVNVIRHFVPGMVKKKKGIVVNFSSGWGRSTDAEVAPYCATKWGVEGLTLAMAQELPSGMAAVSFNPGLINTEMLQACFGKSASNYASPGSWAKTAVPFLLKLCASDNGKQLDAPS